MSDLLIAEFGGEVSLEVKNDPFFYIAFNPKETLVEFENFFYVEGKKRMVSQKITIT